MDFNVIKIGTLRFRKQEPIETHNGFSFNNILKEWQFPSLSSSKNQQLLEFDELCEGKVPLS